jgi:hypothetical protein
MRMQAAATSKVKAGNGSTARVGHPVEWWRVVGNFMVRGLRYRRVMKRRSTRAAGQTGDHMTDGVQFVFQLHEKIQGLIRWAIENGFELNSMRAIERAIGLKRATLASNMRDYRMSAANQLRLAEAYGFDVGWPEWRDPRARKRDARSLHRDSAEAFITRFVAEKATAGSLTIEAEPTCKHIDIRFANFSFAVPGSHKPEQSTVAIPLTVELSFDRRGWSVLLEEGRGILTIGLKQADLQLFHERAGAKIEIFPLAQSNGTDANFRGDVEGLHPWWVINRAEGDPPWLAGKRVSNGSRNCMCHGFRAGDKIQARMTARVRDCFADLAGELFDGQSPTKILLIKHFAKLRVLQDAEALLCEQTLTVVNKLSTGMPRC